MPHAQAASKTPKELEYHEHSVSPLHSIECVTIGDIESLSVDDIKNYVNLLQQHEQLDIA